MKKYDFGLRCAGTVFIFAMAPTVALAYIDPGNGAYMVQALFALVGAALFYLRHPIRSLKELWRWCTSRGQKPAARPLDVNSPERMTAEHDEGAHAIADVVREDGVRETESGAPQSS